MRNIFVIVSLSAAVSWGQPVVAPTPEAVGTTRGENIGGYNITNSFELEASRGTQIPHPTKHAAQRRR